MPPFARVAAAAAIGVLLVGGAFMFFGRPNQSSVGPPSPATPTASSSAAPASAPPQSPPLGLAIVNVDDGNVRGDLDLPLDAWAADLSSDGRLAFLTRSEEFGFCGGCGRAWRIAIVDTEGAASGYVLGPDVDAARDLAWSPDGTRLAFSNDDGAGNIDIYVVDVGDQSEVLDAQPIRLTTDPAIDEFPAWTSDGNAIVYDNMGADEADVSGFSPTQEIWSVTADGGTPTQLTSNGEWDSQPDVSADGTIVFSRGGGIFAMGLDGSDQRMLGTVPGGFNPRWSPDGTRVAVLVYDPSERAVLPAELGRGTDGPLLRVLVADVTTGDETVVGARVVSDVNPPSWTADGAKLLINRYDDGG